MTQVNDAFTAFVQAQAKTGRINPYWIFDDDQIKYVEHHDMDKEVKEANPDLFGDIPFKIEMCKEALHDIRTYFRVVYESWHSEAQVLCVRTKDAPKLEAFCIPCLPKTYSFMGEDIKVFVLPQDNTGGNSCISEQCWQKLIVKQNIYPVARIHSHHILDAYQSATDYSTLNSNTLELVMGRIFDDALHVGFWLDVYGTSAKENVWVATESEMVENEPTTFEIIKVPCGDLRVSKMRFNKNIDVSKNYPTSISGERNHLK